MAATVKSEEILGERWDRCIADTAVKIGGGLGIGAVASLLLFKRRLWPVIFGIGSGFGMGYSNCNHELNKPFSKPCGSKSPEKKSGCCHGKQ
uniref:MICOS complex subunit MIC10 n=1 Tax=Lepeophtheirus salmonis TaxID=72036 RepID=A0A0K2UFM3_LEPSM|nr:MICOS complex subunit Mic10-like [Lepeophtheirus salmonis]